METNTARVLSWVILLVLFWLGVFVIPRIMLKRALFQVMGIFRETHSLCSETPKTPAELGLAPQSLMDRMFKFRDYKPYALQVLIRSGIVRLTGGGRVCLLEDKIPNLWQTNKQA